MPTDTLIPNAIVLTNWVTQTNAVSAWNDPQLLVTGGGVFITALASGATLWTALIMAKQTQNSILDKLEILLKPIQEYCNKKWAGELYTKIYIKRSYTNKDIYNFAFSFTLQNDEWLQLSEYLVKFEFSIKKMGSKSIKYLRKIKKSQGDILFLLCEFTYLFQFPGLAEQFDTLCRKNGDVQAKGELKNICMCLRNTYFLYNFLLLERYQDIDKKLIESQNCYDSAQKYLLDNFTEYLAKKDSPNDPPPSRAD